MVTRSASWNAEPAEAAGPKRLPVAQAGAGAGAECPPPRRLAANAPPDPGQSRIRVTELNKIDLPANKLI